MNCVSNSLGVSKRAGLARRSLSGFSPVYYNEKNESQRSFAALAPQRMPPLLLYYEPASGHFTNVYNQKQTARVKNSLTRKGATQARPFVARRDVWLTLEESAATSANALVNACRNSLGWWTMQCATQRDIRPISCNRAPTTR
eukprot:scaffold329455_cov32-Prasinocladus_malaysianus.AAC.1